MLFSDLFRFFEVGTELVEIESGKTQNEPVGYAVRAAIEAATISSESFVGVPSWIFLIPL